ncbi:MAG: ATP-binding cassette domain-containing protein [Chthoniobacterales bacterium]
MAVKTKEKHNTVSKGLEQLLRIVGSARAVTGRAFRRIRRTPRGVTEGPNLLPTLIKVLAAFARVDGEVLEEEIDSSLGFLRYDYPEAVYSELRKFFRDALHEQQDLSVIAQRLSNQLSDDRKILLGVQLYDLIARAGLKHDQVIAYYSFMSQLGMAAQAIDIVYQLNADDQVDSAVYQENTSPLECVSFGATGIADVSVTELTGKERLLAYRYHDLIILKNLTHHDITVQGRTLREGGLCRIYPTQRIIIGEQVLTQQEIVFYLNAKKNVSLPQIFVAVNEDDEVRLEKARTRESCLEVTFGLTVRVMSLKNVDAVLKGVRLTSGTVVNVTLEDKIVFHNDSELELADLRRRARFYGGRFHLTASKSEYLVSNNPSLLDEGDILLSPGSGGDVLLKIFCDYETKEGRVEVIQSDRPILVRDIPVRNSALLKDGDTIRLDAGQILRCNFSERLIEEERNIIRNLEMRDVSCRFSNDALALDGISFAVQRGEMICVMGASGCGKSTLLRTISGQFKPVQGDILLNGRSLYTEYDALKKYIAYVPQHDAFDENLTIVENLDFASALRSPHLSRRERLRRIESRLTELGLSERRNSVVGSPHKKNLSGGERKRLNIGLDMIGLADVYLFDEPTSGLSSKDSEHVVEIIRSLAHNKIVIVTIHQPSSKIFQMFQKVILLDKGGKLVFFGTTAECLKYFAEAEHQQHFGTAMGTCEACGASRPEFIFDVLETPLRDLSGDIIFEENQKGQLIPARRYSPDYWRDKYETYHLLKDVQQMPVAKDALPPPPEAQPSVHTTSPIRWRDEWSQFYILLQRSFISKLRNRGNLVITLLLTPALASLIGWVLRYADKNRAYDFASAFHIPLYLFMTLVVAMFWGLLNSVDDIIADRPVLLRERNLNIRLGYYVTAKVISIGFFAVIQCALYVLIADAMLSIRGMFWVVFFAMFLTTVSGIGIGLLISALAPNGKTAVMITPFILIPQIMLSGALIKYEEMNKNAAVIYSITQWFEKHPDTAEAPRTDLQIPFICELMPMRWSYEALIYAQAKLNPLTYRQVEIQKQIDLIARQPHLTDAQGDRLEDLKELLAVLSGLEAKDADWVDEYMRRIDRVIAGGPFQHKRLQSKTRGVTAEQIYVNQKITDMVSKAEMEQSDYREHHVLNVFFGPIKNYFGIQANVIVFNTCVLVFSTMGMFFIVYLILRRQVRTRTV